MKKNTKKTVSKGISKGKKVAIGAGVAVLGAAAAAGAAGAYYLLGPNAKDHQKKAKDLMAKMKKEAMAEFKKAKKVGVPVYNKAVDAISKNYAKKYKEHAKDIEAIAKKLKSEWKAVETSTKKAVKKATKKAVKAVKAVNKKV